MQLSRVKIGFVRAFAFMALLVLPVLGQLCGPDWAPSGFASSVQTGASCSVVFDDGTGPKLYVGGGFVASAGIPTAGVAAWDGTTWLGVGGGLAGGAVTALCVHDDGSGSTLFACGWFSGGSGNFVSKLSGGSWIPIGSGFDNGAQALASYDDGTGLALYCGGWFSATNDNTVLINHIGKWDGTVWSNGRHLASAAESARWPSLAAPCTSPAASPRAGGVAAQNIVRYNGTWAAVGGASSSVGSFTVFDDGTGPALYTGGFFTTIGGGTASRVAKYDGTDLECARKRPGRNLLRGRRVRRRHRGGAVRDRYVHHRRRQPGHQDREVEQRRSGPPSVRDRRARTTPLRLPDRVPARGCSSVARSRTVGPSTFPLPTSRSGVPRRRTSSRSPRLRRPSMPERRSCLTVVAGGVGRTYQWRKYGSPIGGATNPTFNIPCGEPARLGRLRLRDHERVRIRDDRLVRASPSTRPSR